MKSLLKTKGAAKPVVDDNPYLATRRSWNSHIVALETQNQLLKIGLIGATLVLAIAVGGISVIGTKAKFVPYLVEVDKLGDALAIDPATRMTSALDPRYARSALSTWIGAVRAVTPDIALEKRNIYLAYSFVKDSDPSKAVLNEWFNGAPGTDPISRSRKELVDVDVGSILELSANSWQVDWVETARAADGNVFSKKRYRAVLDIYLDEHPNESEGEIRLNPLGLYIRHFHWTELVTQ